MKKLMSTKYFPIYAVVLAIPFLLPAQNPTGDKLSVETRSSANVVDIPAAIAFINIQQVIAACEEGKRENDDWQHWAEKKQSELEEIRKERDDLKNKLDIQGDKLIEEARLDLVDIIDAKDILLQRGQQDVQREADRRQRRLANTVYQKVLPVIEKIAEERSLDSVFFIDGNRDAYIRPSLLVTEEVIDAYNAAYPIEDQMPPQ